MGGIVGSDYSSDVINCQVTNSEITGTDNTSDAGYTGGIVGYTEGNVSDITECVFNGTVTAAKNLAGIVGYNNQSYSRIASCLVINSTINGSSNNIIDGDKLYLNFKDATGIVAGKPYLVKKSDTDNIDSPRFSGVQLTNTTPVTVTSTDGKVSFVGTYSYQSFTADDRSILFLGSGNKLYYPQDDATIGAQRAYFQLTGITAGDLPSSVRSFVLNFGDEEQTTTGIVSLENDKSAKAVDETWFDLSGRPINGRPVKSGIYLHNGMKTVIK